MDYRILDTCLCCGSADLERVLDLGRQPLANDYVRAPAEQPAYPLELFVCRRCAHNQLGVAVAPDRMFCHYLYVSGTSRTLREHFAALARDVLSWVEPRPRRVLDLACNDGTLLAAFRAAGCEVRGIDPAANLVGAASGAGFDVVEGYWPDCRARAGGPFDLVTAANVLAHVADPAGFLAAMLDALTPHGAAVVEFPYAGELVLRTEWDTIYHEHLSYFLAGPFLRLAERAGAAVVRVRRTPVHGGSVRLALRRTGGGHCPEVLALAASERAAGLYEPATYAAFAGRVEGTCRAVSRHAWGLVAAGRRVVGYGASAKGNTLLNRCPLPVSWIADDNPLKHGHLTPGRHVPIRPTAELAGEPDGLGVVLLAWNFADEILAAVRRLRPGRGDEAIHYVPGFRAEPV
jgi:novobiocin biosynthesis protein NovU/D-mycarose 3-C-methyltransferase